MKLSKKKFLLVLILLVILIISGVKLHSIQIANDRSVPSISGYVSPFKPQYVIGELNSKSNTLQLNLDPIGPGEAYRSWSRSDRINFVRSNTLYNKVPLRNIQLKSVQLNKVDKGTDKLIFITAKDETLIITVRHI